MHGYTKDKQKIQTRLRRIEGQVRGIQKIVEEDRDDCHQKAAGELGRDVTPHSRADDSPLGRDLKTWTALSPSRQYVLLLLRGMQGEL